jgi:hypothetical protein
MRNEARRFAVNIAKLGALRFGSGPIYNNALQILVGRHRLALPCTQFAVTI